MAYQHHMGANQSGYPKVQKNLPQHTLHFASLLVGVADVYDALRTVRPYRPAFRDSLCTDDLTQSGTAKDPCAKMSKAQKC